MKLLLETPNLLAKQKDTCSINYKNSNKTSTKMIISIVDSRYNTLWDQKNYFAIPGLSKQENTKEVEFGNKNPDFNIISILYNESLL